MRKYSQHRLELVSERALRCLGDVDVLNMLGMGEVYQSRDLALLGEEFHGLAEVFVKAEDLI